MDRRITGFHLDDERHWVAELECGHDQHVRHAPPWVNRPWVSTIEGRARHLGRELACTKCDAGAPRDRATVADAAPVRSPGAPASPQPASGTQAAQPHPDTHREES